MIKFKPLKDIQSKKNLSKDNSFENSFEKSLEKFADKSLYLFPEKSLNNKINGEPCKRIKKELENKMNIYDFKKDPFKPIQIEIPCENTLKKIGNYYLQSCLNNNVKELSKENISVVEEEAISPRKMYVNHNCKNFAFKNNYYSNLNQVSSLNVSMKNNAILNVSQLNEKINIIEIKNDNEDRTIRSYSQHQEEEISDSNNLFIPPPKENNEKFQLIENINNLNNVNISSNFYSEIVEVKEINSSSPSFDQFIIFGISINELEKIELQEDLIHPDILFIFPHSMSIEKYFVILVKLQKQQRNFVFQMSSQ